MVKVTFEREERSCSITLPYQESVRWLIQEAVRALDLSPSRPWRLRTLPDHLPINGRADPPARQTKFLIEVEVAELTDAEFHEAWMILESRKPDDLRSTAVEKIHALLDSRDPYALTRLVGIYPRCDKFHARIGPERFDPFIPRALESARSPSEIRAVLHFAEKRRFGSIAASAQALLSHPDPEVVEGCLGYFRGLADPQHAAVLVPLLDHPNARVRESAIGALEKSGNAGVSPALLPRLNDDDEEVRDRAVWALEELASPPMVPALIAAHDRIPEDVRWPIELLVGKLLKDDVDEARRLWKSRVGWLRATAIEALARAGDTSLAEKILPILTTKDNDVALAVTTYLQAAALCPLASRIIPLLDHSSGTIRVRAIKILGAWNDRKAAPRIVSLLSDPDSRVRTAAAQSVGKNRLRHEADRVALLLDESNGCVRDAAAEALCALDDRRGVYVLLGKLDEWESLLHPLDQLVAPECYRRLTQARATRPLKALPAKLWARIEEELGITIELPTLRTENVSEDEIHPGDELVDLIQTRVIYDLPGARCVVVDPDRLRVLPHDEAIEIWRRRAIRLIEG